jgi:hypothetical protein
LKNVIDSKHHLDAGSWTYNQSLHSRQWTSDYFL